MAINLTNQQINELYLKVSGAIDYKYNEIFDMANATNNLRDMTMAETTDQDKVDLPFMESVVGLSEGAKHNPIKIRTLLGGTHEIPVKKWEDGFEVSKHDVKADRLGQIMARAMDLGSGAALLQRDLILESLRSGDTSSFLMYDGENLFANAHPKGGTTFDNLQAGVLNATNLQAMRVIMMRFPSDAGAARPLNIMPNKLIVPPDLEKTALEFVNNTYVPGGSGEADNFFKGIMEVIVAPELTDVDDWYLVFSNANVKPYIHLSKEGFSPYSIDIEGDVAGTDAYKHEKLIFTGSTYENVYPTRPEFFLKVAN